jgi:hypothetical protein
MHKKIILLLILNIRKEKHIQLKKKLIFKLEIIMLFLKNNISDLRLF